MHLAIHNWMKVEPLETTLARIARLGYDAIELQGEPDKYDTRTVRRLLDEHGLRCWGSVTLMLGERNLLARDEAQRARSIDYVKACVTMVSELGGEVLSVVPGTVGKIVSDGTPEQEWGWAVEALKEIYDHARKRSVRLAIEPINRFETYFINRVAQALALAEAVGPECGVCVDVFHMNIEEADTFAALKAAGDRIANVHVADNNRMAPGMGWFDWPRLIDAVRATGYDGALSVEFSPPLDRTPANPYPDATDPDPEHVSPAERKFLEDHGSSVISERFYTMLTRRSIETLRPLI
ncbi:MAG: sugar phosphate isomerase/epimerase [Bacteroidetes bacterium]|nr:MAG: sugar phosphate isomerase/epimerase [Bacteroidota bacterium]